MGVLLLRQTSREMTSRWRKVKGWSQLPRPGRARLAAAAPSLFHRRSSSMPVSKHHRPSRMRAPPRRPAARPSRPRPRQARGKRTASYIGWGASSIESSTGKRCAGCRATYISRARLIARMTACDLFSDSWCSISGTESATMPAPDWIYPLPFCVMRERIAMQESRLPEKSA